jgi:DNA (cytosine-5)-methyltransferase 1
MKLLSLFSGVGAFENALTRQKIPFELVNYCEWDKYASKAYSIIHGIDESMNLGDITKIDETKLPDFDLMTWGFPCQDISIAGKQEGIKHGTRSGLYYDGLRMLKHKKPKWSIIENVKALTQKKFKVEFEQILKDLSDAGYNNYWKVLNAKDFGIPQNRERVFIVSIRKDIDNGKFFFPTEELCQFILKDMLEDEVDEKYYLKENSLIPLPHQSICYCIDANYHKGANIDTFINKSKRQLVQVGMLDIKGNEQVRRVYSDEGLSPTLNTMGGGNRQPKIVERTPLKFLNRNGKKIDGNYAFCVDTAHTGGVKEIDSTGYRIRKLTPLECFRLMGFDDLDYYKLHDVGISNTQLYKMAGNSIVVNVLEAIFGNLFKKGE